MNESITNKQPPKRVKVRLKKPHTHAGKQYDEKSIKKGVEIDVTEKQAQRLKTLGVI